MAELKKSGESCKWCLVQMWKAQKEGRGLEANFWYTARFNHVAEDHKGWVAMWR